MSGLRAARPGRTSASPTRPEAYLRRTRTGSAAGGRSEGSVIGLGRNRFGLGLRGHHNGDRGTGPSGEGQAIRGCATRHRSSMTRWRSQTALSGSPPTSPWVYAVSYTHLRAHETVLDLVCRLLLE